MAWFEENLELYEKDKKYIRKEQKELHFKEMEKKLLLIGNLTFHAVFEGVPIDDTYFIEIIYPNNYPEIMPITREIRGKIDSKYEHKFQDGSFCLGPHNEIYEKFYKNPCLQNYIKELVIPYLYTYSYLEKYNEYPWGEWSALEIQDYYKKLLDVDNILDALKILKLLISKKRVGEFKCPCRSKKKFWCCHGKEDYRLKFVAPTRIIQKDIEFLKKHLIKNKTNV